MITLKCIEDMFLGNNSTQGLVKRIKEGEDFSSDVKLSLRQVIGLFVDGEPKQINIIYYNIIVNILKGR